MADSNDPSSNHIKINEQVWPLERDIMSRPDRMKYVRKIIKPKNCVFCEALKAQKDTDFVLCKTEFSFVVLNRYPYNNGHLLVLPQSHVGDMGELSESEYMDLSLLVRKSVGILQKAYSCKGLNVGLNQGQVAGAGIPIISTII